MAANINPVDAFIASRPPGDAPHPDRLADPDGDKSTLLSVISWLGLAGHVIFFGLALAIGSTTLAIVNVGSCAAFGLAIAWSRRGKFGAVVWTICVELSVHALVACSILGLEWGFEYYLWTASAFLLVNPMMRPTAGRLVAGLPIAVLGIAHAAFHDVTYPYDNATVVTLVHAANLFTASTATIVAISAVRSVSDFQRDELTMMASIDPLTEIENRRAGFERLSHCTTDAPTVPLCAALADLDHFKAVNDRHGHDVGDLVLQHSASVLAANLRAGDSVARWGGEEFLLILPATELAEATTIVERLRLAVIASPTPGLDSDAPGTALHDGEPLRPVTMSFGLSQIRPDETLREFLKRLDFLLYEAKAAGRDLVRSG